MQRTLKVIEKLDQYDSDLFEIRLDLMKDTSSLAAIRRSTNRPMIATIRRKGDGGFFHGTEVARSEALIQAARAGFDYVDVELNTKKVREVVRRFEHEGRQETSSRTSRAQTRRIPQSPPSAASHSGHHG